VIGIDTVKLSYPVPVMAADEHGHERSLVSRLHRLEGWKRGKWGSVGPCTWTEWVHDDGLRVVDKGVGEGRYILWESSVPKFLGMAGVAAPADVALVDRYVRSLLSGLHLAPAVLRRVDVTQDFHDPTHCLLRAADGWVPPHPRARYTQAVHTDPATGGRTVWLHNKSRGVRVYDKYAECGEEWARDHVRVEYQIRSDWVAKYGLDRITRDFAACCERSLAPAVESLAKQTARSWALFKSLS